MKKRTLRLTGIAVLMALLFSVVPAGAQAVQQVKNYTFKLRYVYYYPTGYRQITDTTQSSFRTLSYGMVSQKVLEVQKDLAQLGYPIPRVNGYYDYYTLVAVARFQADNELPVTAKVDLGTYDLIKEKVDKQEPVKPPAEEPAEKPDPQPEQPPTQQPKPAEEPSQQPSQPPTQQPDQQPIQEEPKQEQPAQEPAPVQGLTADEQKMFNLINQERASQGLKPLQIDLTLVKLARLKSQDMIDKNYFSHQSPTYGSPFDMMKAYGVSYRWAGENLAGAPTVESAHRNLMNSPGHRANILKSEFTHVGIGIIDGGPYGKMFTQMFIGK